MDAEKIVQELSLEEKAALTVGAAFWFFEGNERLCVPRTLVTDGPHGIRKQKVIDSLMGSGESVEATCFPPACLSAASWNPDLIEEEGSAIAAEASSEGVSIVLGPGTNIKRSPLCGRNFEYFSEDPFLSGEIASAWIKGVQKNGIGTSLKHFAANSQEKKRLVSNSVVDERALREIYLSAFEKAVRESQPWTVMCSYNMINGTYSSDNRWLLTDVLREEWGFEGLTMTDWGATADRVAGAKAGMDVEMPSSGGMNDKKLVSAVKAGELDERVLDVIADRVIDLALTSPERREEGYDAEAHDKAARKAAANCAVLLKNAGALPLSEGEKVLVVGEMAAKPRFQGAGSSFINAHKITSLLDALSQEGVTYAYEPGYPLEKRLSEKKRLKLLSQAEAQAAKYEKVIVMAGLPASFEAEGFDRSHMRLPKEQDELIARLAAVNKNVVVVLAGGGAMELPWADAVNAVLFIGLAGQNSGGASVDVLTGKVNPSGKLAESFPFKYEDCPSAHYFPGKRYLSEYRESVFVGYRYYLSAGVKVRYPFGHGLSYTTFQYSDLTLSKKKLKEGEGVEVSFTLKNTGLRAGAEVAQVYVGDLTGETTCPALELKGSKKVFLEAGEEKRVAVTLPPRAFMHWSSVEGDWAACSGAYRICVAASCEDVRLSEEIEMSAPAHKFAPCSGWYLSPSPAPVTDGEFSDLLRRPLTPEKPLPQKGAFTVNDSFNDMAPQSGLARFIIRFARRAIALSMHAPADDPNCKMMHEVMITSPLRSLSFSSQGMFNEKMADGLLLMLNGSFFKGLGKMIGNIGKK